MEQTNISLWLMVVCVGTGVLLQLVSFSAPHWNRFETENWGLWQRCPSSGDCVPMSADFITDTMAAGRGLQVLGLVADVILTVLVCLFVVWRRDCRLLTASTFTALISVTSELVGGILWASTTNTSLSWCYYLCYVSGLCIAAGAGTLVYIRRQTVLKQLHNGPAIV